MHPGRTISPLERLLALVLASIWILGGCVAIFLSLFRARAVLVVCALLAIVYGVTWLRVSTQSRLLTWPELLRPWKNTDVPEKRRMKVSTKAHAGDHERS